MDEDAEADGLELRMEARVRHHLVVIFFFSSRRRHTRSVSAFLLNRSSDLSALAGGAMSKLFGGGQKAASGGIQGDVLATDNNTVGMGDAGIKSAIQGSNVPNPDEAVPS